MKELWKDVLGFEGRYQISNQGNIKSLIGKSPKLLKPGINKPGYKMIILRKQNKSHMRMIHRLVAEAFIPNPKGKKQVNHIDADKLNNCVSNLEWVSAKENARHAWDLGIQEKGANHHLSRSILQIDPKTKVTLKRWGCLRDAEREKGFDTSAIGRAAKGIVKTSYGFIWKYAE